MGRGGAEGEREECQADSRLIVEPDTVLSLMTLSSWPDLKPDSDVQLVDP